MVSKINVPILAQKHTSYTDASASILTSALVVILSNHCCPPLSSSHRLCRAAGLSVVAIVSAGLLTGHKIVGVRMILEDGVSHAVDSSELAFRLAAMGAMRASVSVRGGDLCVGVWV